MTNSARSSKVLMPLLPVVQQEEAQTLSLEVDSPEWEWAILDKEPTTP